MFKNFKDDFIFGSKAETLENLKGRLSNSEIPLFFYFSYSDWLKNNSYILEKISNLKSEEFKYVIIRSSAINEDGEIFANAGAFLSIQSIDPSNKFVVEEAILKVFNSYKNKDKRNIENEDQILIQRMIENPSMSGVVFTHSMNTGAPYYVINYDDVSGSTETITQGDIDSNRTLYVSRKYWEELTSERFINLIRAIKEIENITNCNFLDIEFSLRKNLDVQIFQVRRITTQPNWSRGLSMRVEDVMKRLKETISPLLVSNNKTFTSNIFGKMPDWNPAEIIGNSPRHLSYSLYRYLITDNTWRIARKMMGYSDPKGSPLMHSFGGQPFINVKKSFFSFIPKGINADIKRKLLNHWISNLRKKPYFHDKVEFKIALTCWTFDFDKKIEELCPNNLKEEEINEIKEKYFKLTKKILNEGIIDINKNIEITKSLLKTNKDILHDIKNSTSLEIISRLIEDIKEKGTLSFSILARHAFIGNSILRSLVDSNLISNEDSINFQKSYKTITTDFLNDLNLLSNKKIDLSLFLEKYGHLRPGTYDILSFRYDQRDFSSPQNIIKKVKKKEIKFTLDPDKLIKLDNRLEELCLEISGEQVLNYIKESAQARELSKFIFTRCLSDLLEIIALWGNSVGLSREELSHIDIREILDCLTETSGRSIEDFLRPISEKRAREYEISKAIKLPNLITRPSDLVIVPTSLDQPNFIGSDKARGKIAFINEKTTDHRAIEKFIIAIDSADPGYDWIFTGNILGLITKYGGANSHMAIRCAELNIPAAIGCGDQIFERLDKFTFVEIDCAAGIITPFH